MYKATTNKPPYQTSQSHIDNSTLPNDLPASIGPIEINNFRLFSSATQYQEALNSSEWRTITKHPLKTVSPYKLAYQERKSEYIINRNNAPMPHELYIKERRDQETYVSYWLQDGSKSIRDADGLKQYLVPIDTPEKAVAIIALNQPPENYVNINGIPKGNTLAVSNGYLVKTTEGLRIGICAPGAWGTISFVGRDGSVKTLTEQSFSGHEPITCMD